MFNPICKKKLFLNFKIKCFWFVLLCLIFCQTTSRLSADQSELLIVSNYPEKLNGPGLILKETYNNSNFRVLFHHVNHYKNKLNFIVTISNKQSETIEIGIKPGVGGPSKDVIYVGHKAAKDFLSSFEKVSKTMSLQPNQTVTLLDLAIKPNNVFSGIFEIINKKNNKLDMTIALIDKEYPQLSLFSDLQSPLNQYSVAQFDNPYKNINYKFDSNSVVGGFEIGGKPYVVDKKKMYSLKGNYGVVYDIDLELENSVNTAQLINIYVLPKKNNAVNRAVFLIEGEIVELDMLVNKNNKASMQKFYEIILQPNQNKKISMLTLPQAGCYYPIDIIINSQEAIL